MPSFESNAGFEESDRLTAGAATEQEVVDVTNYRTRQDPGAFAALTGIAIGGVVDLADSVASSLPGFAQATGIERGEINQAALNAIDSPGVRNFYNDYKEGIEAASGIAGIVGAELVTRKIAAVGRPFLNTVSKIPYVRRIAALDQQYLQAMASVRNVDRALAKRGALGREQFGGNAVVDFKKFDSATGTFVRATQELNRGKQRLKALGLGAARGARHAIATEATLGVMMNQNGFLYEDDAAHNMMWMGLGIVGAGAADWIGGAYHMRKFVNGDEIRREFASALDPEKFEQARNLWHGKKVDPAQDFTAFLGGKWTDEVTSLTVNAKQLQESPVAGADGRALLANRTQLATQQMQQALETTQKVVNKGITSNGFTRFTVDTEGYGNHIKQILNEDPAALYGAEMIGAVQDDMTTIGLHESHMARIETRGDEIKRRLEDPTISPEDRAIAESQARQLEYEKTLTPVAYIDGEAMPISEAAAIEKFELPEIKFNAESKLPKIKLKDRRVERGDANAHGLWEATSRNSKRKVSLNTKFEFHIPGNKSLDSADHFDMLRLYRLGNKAVERMSKFEDEIILPQNPNWFQLDLAEAIIKKSEGNAKVIFPEGMTRESAQVEALAQKAQSLTKKTRAIEKKNSNQIAKGLEPESELSRLRVRYNLPRLTAYERGVTGMESHPVERLLRGIDEHGVDKVRDMSLHELKEAAAQAKRIDDIAPVSAKDYESLSGDSFNYMLDRSGNPIKPILMYKRPFQKMEWSQAAVEDRLAANKLLVAKVLTETDAPLTRTLTQSVMNSPDINQAGRTQELLDIQQQGSIAGTSQQGTVGAIVKAGQTAEFRDRDNPILLAATRIRESVNRQSRAVMQRVISGAFGDNLSKLANPRNAKTELLLNQFHTFRPGWDLPKTPKQTKSPTGEDMYVFPLADTKKNRDRFKQMFGKDMPDNQVMVDSNGTEIALDQLGMEIQQQYNTVSGLLVKEKNALLQATGGRRINEIENYVPPPTTNGKLIGFVMGPDGQPVPGMSVVARTQAEFDAAKKDVLKRMESMGLGYSFRSQDDIREFASIWDRVQMDLIDPSSTAVQPGKTNRGILARSELNRNAFNDSLEYIQNGYLRHGDDIIHTIFKEQINSAKSRSRIAGVLKKNDGKQERHKDIYTNYIENLTGKSRLNDETSYVGRLYNKFERAADAFFEDVAPTTAKTWDMLTSVANKGVSKLPGTDPFGGAKFDKLSKELGEYMPFESAADMLEKKGYGAKPWKTAELVGNMNQFTAATILRMFEVAHPIMNLSGLVNAMPAVIRNFQPRDGEAAADFAKRVGHSGNIFDLGDGRIVGNIDMSKIAGRAFKRAWQRSSHADYDYMVQHGYLSQEVAEFHRQFGAIKSKSNWNSFFLGDETRKGFNKKGVVGWMSVMSDKSEDFSRSWGHMVGLELADNLGIKGIEARNTFAHDIANKMIANYSPENRPEIFQGAVGATLGLFQSFILNYYQRLFRYAETGDGAAFATQYATQGTLFGATSLTGWTQFNELFMDSTDGEEDPTSGVWRKFGDGAGDLLGSGVISNLPKLFGADAVDLYSRGDTNVRLPGFNGVPGLTALAKVHEAITESIRLFGDENISMSTTQLAEVWSNTIPNRPIAGMIEQFMAGGNDTDQYGQLVQDTKNAMEMTYRMMGVRSMRQSQQINAFYSNKSSMEHKSSADEMLRLATRTAMRDGTFEDKADEIFTKYVDKGGDPRYFRRWIKSTYESATTTAAQRQLKAALNNPSKMDQVMRLLDAGVSIDDDENLEDPNPYATENPDDELNQPTDDLGQYSDQLTLP